MSPLVYGALCAVLLGQVISQEEQTPRVVCYVRASSFLSGFTLKNLTSVPCTHIVYSYARLDSQLGTVGILPADTVGLGELIELRSRVRSFKAMIQMGGDEDADSYRIMTSDPNRRRKMIQSMVELCSEFDLDGVDLHWTYPGKLPEEKANYKSLAQELRKEFIDVQEEVFGRRMLISMILPNARELIIPGFNLLVLNTVVDFINLPAYNFSLSDNSSLLEYHHSPLTLPPEAASREGSTTFMTKLYLRVGTVARQLVLGVPLFGKMLSEDGRDEEFIPNNQLCRMIDDDVEWVRKGNALTGPLAAKPDKVISYDNEESVVEKAKLVRDLKLGGIMFWSMDMGDWNGACPKSDRDLYSRWSTIEAARSIIMPKIGIAQSGSLSNDINQTIRQATTWRPALPSGAVRPVPASAPVRPSLPTAPVASAPVRPSLPSAPVASAPLRPSLPPAPVASATVRPPLPSAAVAAAPFSAPVRDLEPPQNGGLSFRFPFAPSPIGGVGIVVEAEKDIIIEDVQEQYNDNYYYYPPNRS